MAITFKITSKTGQKAEGILSWPEKGLSDVAVSGPYGNGYIELGVYHAKRNFLLDKQPSEDAYCDTNNKCWFQRLDAQFASTRTEIGIHPDGNVPGTKGCVGLNIPNTKAWYDAFFAVSPGKHTVVTVTEEAAIV
ncbi:hypothetical protein [Flavobacterium sp.]|uniref:hypothetical protein n=1 Tax=Flavobacterium sp. TaxID=239 RepID=UPI0039E5F60E